MSYTWGASATDSQINSVTVAASAVKLSAAYSNSVQAASEIAMTVTYNASATKGAQLQIMRLVDSVAPTYQVNADSPQAVNLPFTAGGTVNFVFTIDAKVSGFKINLVNLDTGQSMTACIMKVRQATN